MELSTIIPHIECLIFASEKPLTNLDIVELINNAFGFMEERITLDQVEAAVDGIREKYSAEFYPFEVRESGGGWQFLTKREFHKTIAQLNGDKFLKRLSNAAMETLAIIAYKQPITKGEIEAIRGVNSDYSVTKLLEKELIVISGRNEELPGKPLVYSTSKVFMDYFGINSVDDLPKIKEVLADQAVEATVISDVVNQHVEMENNDLLLDEVTGTLRVADNGELIDQAADSNGNRGQEPIDGIAPGAETNASQETVSLQDEGYAGENTNDMSAEAEDEIEQTTEPDGARDGEGDNPDEAGQANGTAASDDDTDESSDK